MKQTSEALGTSSQKISHLISPRLVCSVTDCELNNTHSLVRFKKLAHKMFDGMNRGTA